jgi:ATP synthase protein I
LAAPLTSRQTPDSLKRFGGLIGRSLNTPVKESPDDRSPLVLAMEWTSRVTTIALEMVLPGLLGYWLDRQLGTHLVLLVLGVILGFATGMWHLIKMTKSPPGNGSSQAGSSNDLQERP